MSDAAETPKPSRRIGALRELWPFIKPHKALAFGWLLFLALSSGASLVLPLAKGLSATLKYADYRADAFARDTRKLWLQLDYKGSRAL